LRSQNLLHYQENGRPSVRILSKPW
jgi:hypothetical protein